MSLGLFAGVARPRAAVLLVGNELLAGDVRDDNGPFMLAELRRRGVEVPELRVVADAADAITAAVAALRAAYDHVFVAGGMGPTHDDVTLDAVAAALGVPLVLHEDLLRRVHAHFGAHAPAAAQRLARVPAGAEVRFGQLRLVPLLTVANVTVLPGVPRLLRQVFADVLGVGSFGPPFVRRDLRVLAGEPALAAPLEAVQRDHPEVQLGSYPSFDGPVPEVRLSVQGRDDAAVQAALDVLVALWPAAEVLLPR